MNQSDTNLLELFESPAPAFSDQHVLDILREHYGLEGELKDLASERDQNFLVVASNGEKHLLRVSNQLEDPAITNFQTSAFQHVEKTAPDLMVSRVIPNLNGDAEPTVTDGDGVKYIVRLFSWVEGTALICVPSSKQPDNAEEMGRLGARMAIALKDFQHPAMNNKLLWDVKNAGNLENLLEKVDDETLHKLVNDQMERFKSYVRPTLNKLPSQVVFNDMSPRNIIVDPENPANFSGFIDFGDMVCTARIIDVAVACVYWVNDSEDPLHDVALFLKGYNQLQPLQEEELKVLLDVMLSRTMMQVLIYFWRAEMFPENREYIIQNLPQARRTLEQLSTLDRNEVKQKFQNTCEQSVATPTKGNK